MVRTKPRRYRPGSSRLGPLVRKLVRRRQGAGIRERSVESGATVGGWWFVSVVGGKLRIREETVFPVEGD